jgi:hypothetical protein
MSGLVTRTFYCEASGCEVWHRLTIFADSPHVEKAAFDNLAQSGNWTPTPTGYLCGSHGGLHG